MKPLGYVELDATFVFDTTSNGIKRILAKREKNKSDGVWEVQFYRGLERKIRQWLGLPVVRSEAECIKILKARNHRFWWYYNVSHLADERLEQLAKLKRASKLRKPTLVDAEIAGHLEWIAKTAED